MMIMMAMSMMMVSYAGPAGDTRCNVADDYDVLAKNSEIFSFFFIKSLWIV